MKRLILAICLVLVSLGAVAQTGVVEARRIVVSGEAKRSVTPDEFTIVLTLADSDSKGDKRTAVEKYKALTVELKKVGIDPSALKAADVNNSALGRKDVRTSVVYELRLVGFDNVARAFDAFERAGVRNANLTSSKYSKQEELREELMAEAVRNARRMAGILAVAAEVEVGAPLSIEMPYVRVYSGAVFMSKAARNDAATEESLVDLGFEVKQIEISAQVNVSYEIALPAEK